MKTFGILLLLLLLLSKLLSATEENCFTVVIQTTTENASLQWRTTRLPEQNGCTTRSHNMIKLSCIGSKSFVDTNGVMKFHEIRTTQFFPSTATQGLVSNLQPNVHFKCNMAFIDKAGMPLSISTKLEFSTQTSASPPPQRPIIIQSESESHLFTIELYNTTTQNGPVTGYEVQFIVVDKIPLNDNGVPIVSTGAHGNISLSEQEVAAKAKAATSFYYRYKQQDKLPHFITIKEDLLGNALRNESSYIVVTVAYTNKDDLVLYSNSQPSKVFTIRIMYDGQEKKTMSLPKVFQPESLKSFKKKKFRKSFGKKTFYIGLSAIPLGLLIGGVITTFVYEKATKDYTIRKKLNFYAKRMKKSVKLNQTAFLGENPLEEKHMNFASPPRKSNHSAKLETSV